MVQATHKIVGCRVSWKMHPWCEEDTSPSIANVSSRVRQTDMRYISLASVMFKGLLPFSKIIYLDIKINDNSKE